MREKISIYTDGAARGNPGPSASGFIVIKDGTLLKTHSEYNGASTNNFSEYKAVILALNWCVDNIDNLREKDFELYSDSQLVVRQLNNKYKIKSKQMLELNERVHELMRNFGLLEFKNVKRTDKSIRSVDHSLNKLLDWMANKPTRKSVRIPIGKPTKKLVKRRKK